MEENKKNNSLTISQLETVDKIKRLGGQYDSNSNLSLEDQLFICETLAKTTSIGRDYPLGNDGTNDNAGVSGNGNDSYKRNVNFYLTPRKQEIIKELKKYNYLTPPPEIAKLLEEFFSGCNSKVGHWLYIAQQYTPKTINRVIKRIIKLHNSGRITIQNPAAYFTYLIKLRKRRKVNSYH